jgi:hypothetical protein
LEPPLLLRNEGPPVSEYERFRGPVFAERFGARGLAIGNFDNDDAVTWSPSQRRRTSAAEQ